jgi:chloramphenicol 3-O phosphotransferase
MIVLLNGVSSAGKSSIAAELLDVLDGPPWFHLSVDAFGAMRSASGTHRAGPDALEDVLRRTRAGFHRAVAGMAAAGNDVVMDHLLSEPWRLADCLDVFAGLDVVLVGVHCSPAELTRRELARGDRVAGTAVTQLDRVHAHGLYDLTVDTTSASARACAEEIAAYVRDRPAGPSAFDRLRSSRPREEEATGRPR